MPSSNLVLVFIDGPCEPFCDGFKDTYVDLSNQNHSHKFLCRVEGGWMSAGRALSSDWLQHAASQVTDSV